MRFQHELAPEPKALRVARNEIEAWCDSMDIDAESIVIIANELSTNAIRHGHGSVTISMHSSQKWLGVSIRQHGRIAQSMPTRSAPHELHTSGRGLRIVDALAESWGWLTDADHTVFWARIARMPV